MKLKSFGLPFVASVLISTGCTHVGTTASKPLHRLLSILPVSTDPGSEKNNTVVGDQTPAAGVMAQAHQQMAKAIEATWGSKEVLMPSRKAWVQYDDSMKMRTIMDFERGELRIEHLKTLGESTAQAHQMMESALLKAREQTIADLDKFDMEMRLARQIARRRGLTIAEAAPSPQDASMQVLEGLIDDGSMMSINPQHIETLPMSGDEKLMRTTQIMKYRIRFKPGFQAVLARRYLQPVLEHAQTEDIPPSLIYAIMQIESAFNPRAVSPAPAYGLMQLVPTSGGLDAYEYVYGTKQIVGPEFLFHPGNNIRLGTAYLKILDSRYLKVISNPLSRLYCVIAAYNTGAGNVARAFTGKTDIRSAARVINELTPEQVLQHLKARLPFVETQRYIVKVLSALKNYTVLDESTLAQVL